MSITFDYFSITLLIGGFSAILSGAIVFLHNRRHPENQAWLALNISSAVWSFAYFSMIIAERKEIAVTSNLVLHAAAILIPLFYFLTILAITKTFNRHRFVFYAATLTGLFFLIINPTSDFVRDVIPKLSFNFAPDAGPLYGYFAFYFFAIVIYALFVVFAKFRETTDQKERARLRTIVLFTIAGFGGGGSVFLLTFNIMMLPYPLILFALYPSISGYAIFRYQLFDTKVIATQIIVFSLWILIFIRALLAEALREQLFNGALLVAVVVIGLLLIRSVRREVTTREKIERLAKELESANERLKELDQLKTEFVSLATHQIRGPIAAIKGYASMLLEGDFGVMPAELRKPVETIMESSASLAGIVQDFLDISRIEQGRMKFELSDFDASALVSEVLTEFKPSIEGRGLSFMSQLEPGIVVHADPGKLRQVVENLIDNALKYTPRGGISVRVKREGSFVRISVEDTGMGIKPETLPKLFKKFSRAEDASKANLLGTGLGLYVAKELVTAMKGAIRAESAGEGKGSTFIVEIPLRSKYI